MFTGIIRITGIVKEAKSGALRIAPKGLLRAPLETLSLTGRVRAGDSVAVNGVCLTVESFFKKWISFSLMPATLKATTLRDLKKGDVVNLELPLRYGDRVGGHFVLGHVDGVGEIVEVRLPNGSRTSRCREISVRVPSTLKKYCAPKGSIALDGVSLTIVSARGRNVLVSLTPYTLQHTRFANVRVGDRVNVEVDVLARYLKQRK